MNGAMPIRIEISPGELLDRISILRIKAERVRDVDKARIARAQLEALLAVWSERLEGQDETPAEPDESGKVPRQLEQDLRRVNESIWDAEDALRACERRGDFGPEFVAWARSVYRNNDLRCELNRRIDAALGSPLAEIKSHG